MCIVCVLSLVCVCICYNSACACIMWYVYFFTSIGVAIHLQKLVMYGILFVPKLSQRPVSRNKLSPGDKIIGG